MKKQNKQSVLVIAAHPDDEVLGCGGMIQKHVAQGNQVFLCIVTEGASIQYPNDPVKQKQRAQDCEKAASILGIDKIFWLDFINMKLGTETHVQLNQKLEKLFLKILPSIVYTPSLVDVNHDHIEVQKSIEVVCRPGSPHVRNLKKVLAYEILSSSEWSLNSSFKPNVFIDIGQYLDKKIKALLAYRTEVRPYPHPRSPEGIKILAEYRGLQAGVKAAEAFQLLLIREK